MKQGRASEVGRIPLFWAKFREEKISLINADKYYELITAALQRLTMPQADVTWNSKIGNRQFDVRVRIEAGMHSLLLAYEVKHKSRATSVEALDAFVTKARDA